MHRKIGLTITVEIESSEHHSSCDWLFENSGRNWIAILHDDPGNTDVDGNKLCVGFHMDSPGTDRRLVTVDIDDSLGKGLRRFLRQIMPDAALDKPVRILADEFFPYELGSGRGAPSASP
jgi:hypothetical protein